MAVVPRITAVKCCRTKPVSSAALDDRHDLLLVTSEHELLLRHHALTYADRRLHYHHHCYRHPNHRCYRCHTDPLRCRWPPLLAVFACVTPVAKLVALVYTAAPVCDLDVEVEVSVAVLLLTRFRQTSLQVYALLANTVADLLAQTCLWGLSVPLATNGP